MFQLYTKHKRFDSHPLLSKGIVVSKQVTPAHTHLPRHVTKTKRHSCEYSMYFTKSYLIFTLSLSPFS